MWNECHFSLIDAPLVGKLKLAWCGDWDACFWEYMLAHSWHSFCCRSVGSGKDSSGNELSILGTSVCSFAVYDDDFGPSKPINCEDRLHLNWSVWTGGYGGLMVTSRNLCFRQNTSTLRPIRLHRQQEVGLNPKVFARSFTSPGFPGANNFLALSTSEIWKQTPRPKLWNVNDVLLNNNVLKNGIRKRLFERYKTKRWALSDRCRHGMYVYAVSA